MVRRLGLEKNNHLTYASLALNPRFVPVTYTVLSFDPNTYLVFTKIFFVFHTEWSYEPYSGSDSSDLYYHSDSSESQGNKWHYHGYQLYKPKENYKAITYKYPVKNHSFSTVQEFEKNCVSCNSSVDHKSRHNRKESGNSNAKVKFRDDYKLKSDSGNDRFEPIKKKPMISKDDVYDLLSKSRAQENKVAELWQTKDNHNYSGHQPQFASVCGNTCSPIKDDHSMAIRRKVYGSK